MKKTIRENKTTNLIPMHTTIYAMRNTVNGKVYIGHTINLEKRMKNHLYKLRKGIHINKEIQRDYNEYGEDVFEFEVITEVDNLKQSERINLENKYIELYQTKIFGYNLLDRNEKGRKRLARVSFSIDEEIFNKLKNNFEDTREMNVWLREVVEDNIKKEGFSE
ncbi:GIY-YIG nuclease family protein [Macrococcus armenti]|uniref:GIY-YIG nuclease family protein n=1 Tax=Macrococcus armenti TaxID=2875764 RepID=UPI001CCCB47B|nr:GIY-YIG nuclease family protein [Macrococcus armenti]UBH07830.1 GIY-YIG nuclease family protein [Macrococcus armenti]